MLNPQLIDWLRFFISINTIVKSDLKIYLPSNPLRFALFSTAFTFASLNSLMMLEKVFNNILLLTEYFVVSWSFFNTFICCIFE